MATRKKVAKVKALPYYIGMSSYSKDAPLNEWCLFGPYHSIEDAKDSLEIDAAAEDHLRIIKVSLDDVVAAAPQKSIRHWE